jgi:hypothetical protein
MRCATILGTSRPAKVVDIAGVGSSYQQIRNLEGDPMKYLMLVCTDGEPIDADPAELNPEPWVTEMDGRGIRLIGDRLRPPSDATTVRVRDGETLITDGPFVETKELVGGFDILECADLDEAIEVASKHPMAKVGMLELRPFWPL